MILSTFGLLPATLAYIGPGGGIALLGPLLGVLAAVIAAVGMIAVYPLRALLKKLKANKDLPQRTS